jgi:glycosyltransferase involved in cell wall biosynthesis
MRIGIDASFLRKPGTGIGQVTFHFLETLKAFPEAHAHEFFLYTEAKLEGDIQYPDFFRVKSFLPWWKRDDLIRKVLWEGRVAKEAQKDGCDVFLSLYQSSTIAPKEMRHIMVVHDIIPRIFPQYQGNMRQKYHWKLVERGIKKAHHIIAVSSATKNDLVEFGIDHEDITVASPDVAPIFRKDLTPEEENRVMATYALVPGYIYHGGGLEIRKNTEGLLRAYKLLSDKEKAGVLGTPLPSLVISGKIFREDNPLATPVKKLLRELGLGDRVKLLDFVPEKDLPALYKNALFFVYPSRYEGFGLPVLEALCMKTPVLTSDNSSLPEVAQGAALYIDPEHTDSLASGMERLLSDAALRKTLCEHAEQTTTRFSWKIFTKTVLDSLS